MFCFYCRHGNAVVMICGVGRVAVSTLAHNSRECTDFGTQIRRRDAGGQLPPEEDRGPAWVAWVRG